MGVLTLLLPVCLAASPAEGELRGRTVRELAFVAAPSEDVSTLRALSAVQVGDTYSPAAVRRTIKVLIQLGRFENVIARVAPIADRGLLVSFEVVPLSVLRRIRFLQTGDASRSFIRQALAVEPGRPIDARDLPRLQEKLEESLGRSGWLDPAVGLALQTVDDSGGRDLLVRVEPGPRTRLRQIRFEGPRRRADYILRRWLAVREGRVLDLDEVERNLVGFAEQFRAAGHYDVEVSPPSIQRLGPSDADLIIVLDPGPVVDVSFEGNKRVSVRLFRTAAEDIELRGTDPSILREVRDRIEQLYEQRGLYAAKVQVQAATSPDGDRKRVRFIIDEGPLGRVGKVSFPGRRSVSERDVRDAMNTILSSALGSVGEQPGADPPLVTEIIGGHTSPQPAPRRAPDTSAPDAKLVYVARAYRAVANGIAALYRSRGFQQVNVDRPRITEREGLIDVSIAVEEGPRWVVGALDLEGALSFGRQELMMLVEREPGLVVGGGLVLERVEDARRRLVERYEESGHLYVSVEEEIVVPEVEGERSNLPLEHCAELLRDGQSDCPLLVRFVVKEGPQVYVRRIVIRGLERTVPGIVEQEIEFTENELLRRSQLEGTRDNLLRVGIFERVTVEPIDADQPEAIKDVVVDLKERKPFTMEVGGGFSTEDGFRAFAGFGWNNLGMRAMRLRVDGKVNFWPDFLAGLYAEELQDAILDFYNDEDLIGPLGRFEYELSLGWTYPRSFGWPRGIGVGADIVTLRNLSPAFVEDTQKLTLTAAALLRPDIGGLRRTGFQLRLRVERTDLFCNPVTEEPPDPSVPEEDDPLANLRAACNDPTSIDAGSRGAVSGSNAYVGPIPRVTLDWRDDPVDPSLGAFFQVEGEYARSLIRTTDNETTPPPDLARVEARLSGFVPLSREKRLVLAVGLQLSRIWALTEREDATVPINRRYFAGGRTTIRGYAERTLVPQDVSPRTADGTLRLSQGGILSAFAQTELRWRVWGPLGVAGFYDIGDLFEDGTFRVSQTVDGIERSLAQSVGAGVRLATPVGPLALDLGFPVTERDEAPDFQIHFSIGTF